MKKIIALLTLTFMFTASYAYVVDFHAPKHEVNPTIEELADGLQDLTVEDILSLTPKKYKEITGKRMSMKDAVKLKMAKKKLKKFKKTNTNAAIGKGLYVFLAIIGWGFLGMGLNDDWDGTDWVICLVLGLFTCLGGLIYALVKKKKYY